MVTTAQPKELLLQTMKRSSCWEKKKKNWIKLILKLININTIQIFFIFHNLKSTIKVQSRQQATIDINDCYTDKRFKRVEEEFSNEPNFNSPTTPTIVNLEKSETRPTVIFNIIKLTLKSS